MFEPTPPHNFEIEMGLLAALMSSPRAFDRICNTTQVEHFADDRHQAIYEAIATLSIKGKQVNAATLKTYFDASGTLADIGGTEYLARLQASAVTLINVEDYAAMLRDLWQRRTLMSLAVDLKATAAAPVFDSSADELIEQVMLDLEDVRSSSETGALASIDAAMESGYEMADEAHKRGGGLIGIPTGFIDIDEAMGGLEPGAVYVVAGRPSMGKSALALWMAWQAGRWMANNPVPWDKESKPGAGVYFASLEMTTVEFGYRLLGPLAGVPPFNMRTGKTNMEDFTRLAEARQAFRGVNLNIDQTPAQSISTIRARARAMKRRKGLGLIVVDHIGLMHASREAFKQGRLAVVSEITAGLKQLAKELNVPVVALSQLSRTVESRENKRPQLSDLRDSGTIEQDADVVMFCYRHAYYLERSKPERQPGENDAKWNERFDNWAQALDHVKDLGEVLIAKQRNGPVKDISMHFDGQMVRFSSLAKDAS
jgi:replicative DNA helicase